MEKVYLCINLVKYVPAITTISAFLMLTTMGLMVYQTRQSIKSSKIVKKNFEDINKIVINISKEKIANHINDIISCAINYYDYTFDNLGKKIDFDKCTYRNVLLVRIDIFIAYLNSVENKQNDIIEQLDKYRIFVKETKNTDLLIPLDDTEDGILGIIKFINSFLK
jgi:hypothetical protein